ncbi:MULTISPECIES: hypothetical protein [unclassified Streptomyces]|uniref:hypothetical protein n=1 Tax=unclassified Streptomyces TaxID=2593676 RepID=UPI000DC7D606|nr:MULTISPECIES: hypothetical protein [unclassified Streptomyces]AWZ10725.1 hypothetical protein DRB89_33710 [Streptomyces sp. ICC4]AWZ18435.1 hypothetical protein DRB96_34505 [Streptomyces sp. ICC1]
MKRRPGDGTGGLRTGTATYESLREQAIALRREGLSLRQIRDRLGIHNNNILNGLVKGEPPPEWTKRPNAKDDLRDRARELRVQGMTYDEIQVELGCSKSSISLWVRDLPKPERKHRAPGTDMTRARQGLREAHERRKAEYEETRSAARKEIGALTGRELFIIGVGLYWAEGGKTKPHQPHPQISFTNSDAGMIKTFLAWLRLLEVTDDRLRFTLQIHETTDVANAEQYWIDTVGLDASHFGKTTLKRHTPLTNRKNTGDTYRGCLTVRVLKGSDLYRRIEGAWCGIVGAVESTRRA